ncbi:MAG TPA: hypothetical protein VGG74_15225 [Kofleriaceae bacterium]|jgi:hypothetical protein
MRNSLVLWIAVVACSSSNSIPVDQLETQLDDAYCSYYVKCGAFPDVATCEMSEAVSDDDETAAIMQAVQAGKIDYNGQLAQQCINAIANASCDRTQERGEPAICAQIITGTAGSGSACESDTECKSLACDIPDCGSAACCEGMCVGDAPPPLGGVGSACDDDSSECQNGLYCATSETMESFTCATPGGSGSTCSGGDESCQIGLACDETTELCSTLPGTGEACPHQQCALAGDFCGSDGTCHKDGLPGDACSDSSECSPFYTCDTTMMKCVQGPGVGSSCATAECFDGNTYCDTGSATPTCLQKKADGSTCATDEECESDDCVGSACTAETICL